MLDGSAHTRRLSGSTSSKAAPGPPALQAVVADRAVAQAAAKSTTRCGIFRGRTADWHLLVGMSAFHTGAFSFRGGIGFVLTLRGTATRHVAHGTSAEIDVEIIHVAIDVLVVAESRH